MLISSAILQVYKKLCHGVELLSATGDSTSRRTEDQYVDDADGWNTAPKTNTMAECAENLKTSAQKWATLISITGGLMSFHKVNWQAMAFVAVAGFFLIKSSANITEEIILQDDNGQSHKIPRLPTTAPNPALGFHLCPTADQKPEYEKRYKQAKECASKASAASLSIQDTWVGLKTRVIT